MRQFQNIEVGTEVGIIEYRRYGRGIYFVCRGTVVDTTTKTFKVVWNRKSGPSEPVTYNKNTGIEWGRGDSWTQRGRVTLDMDEVARCEEALAVERAEEEAKACAHQQERDRITGLNKLHPDCPTYKVLAPLADLVQSALENINTRRREPSIAQHMPSTELKDLYVHTSSLKEWAESDYDAINLGYTHELIEIWSKIINSATHWESTSPAMRAETFKAEFFRSAEDESEFAGDNAWIEKRLRYHIQDLLDAATHTPKRLPHVCNIARQEGERTAQMAVLRLLQRFWINPDYRVSAR
jgi:hypothetical protein